MMGQRFLLLRRLAGLLCLALVAAPTVPAWTMTRRSTAPTIVTNKHHYKHRRTPRQHEEQHTGGFLSSSSSSIDSSSSPLDDDDEEEENEANSLSSSSLRRQLMTRTLFGMITGGASTAMLDNNNAMIASATESVISSTPTLSPEITDKIYIDITGLPSASSVDPKTGSTVSSSRRLVIGLFGRNSPLCVSKLKQLVSKDGLYAECRPRAIKQLQKEQLEANKVYNRCLETIQEEPGVKLRYSTIWRIIPNERIDIGAVSGKYISREFPTWQEEQEKSSSSQRLRHDIPGTVSVRRGNDGGFGFTIYTGGNGDDDSSKILDEENIVVGRVLLDDSSSSSSSSANVLDELNTKIPVITTTSAVNYMSITGGSRSKTAPDRSCRYGGNMYCNENKPLIKLTISNCGIF